MEDMGPNADDDKPRAEELPEKGSATVGMGTTRSSWCLLAVAPGAPLFAADDEEEEEEEEEGSNAPLATSFADGTGRLSKGYTSLSPTAA